MADARLDTGTIHHGWDRSLEPAATVAPGDTVELACRDASAGQLTPRSTSADVLAVDGDRVNPVTGPIAIDGAEPGDVLVVEVLGVHPSDWGWSALIPGFGLLAGDFPEPHLLHSRVAEGSVDVGGLATLPARPFLGTVGLAPSAEGVHDVIPPRRVGGNLDTRDVVAGARLHLPVEVEGALLSVGDGHAAQGDGEVCGTAVETPVTCALRLEVRRDRDLAAPHLEVPDRGRDQAGATYQTTGVAPSLEEAARTAVREAIEVQVSHAGRSPEDAYVLCSVAGHLRIREIVDAPNWVVSLELPRELVLG